MDVIRSFERLAKMLRTLTATSPNNMLPHPNLPFTKQSLAAIRAALVRDRGSPTAAVDPKEKHAAVLIPLCNVNDRPGILLELRGKLRTHSGEVRYATRRGSYFLLRPQGSLMDKSHITGHIGPVPAFREEGWTRYVTRPTLALRNGFARGGNRQSMSIICFACAT